MTQLLHDPIEVRFFTRQHCSLCDKAKVILEKLLVDYDVNYRVVDIDTDDALIALYTTRVPVVTIDEKVVFIYRVDPDQARLFLEQARDRRRRQRGAGS